MEFSRNKGMLGIESLNKISAVALAACSLLFGCFIDTQDSGATNDLVGRWEQPFVLFIKQSTHFDNKEGIDTRVPYLGQYDLDSNSCKPNLLAIDTLSVSTGTWEFKRNGRYTRTSVYQVPKPITNNGDTTKVFDTSTVSREYEISNDTLRLIANRINGLTAFEIRTFAMSENRDTLKITREEVSYIHGNCHILKLQTEQLIRKK